MLQARLPEDLQIKVDVLILPIEEMPSLLREISHLTEVAQNGATQIKSLK